MALSSNWRSIICAYDDGWREEFSIECFRPSFYFSSHEQQTICLGKGFVRKQNLSVLTGDFPSILLLAKFRAGFRYHCSNAEIRWAKHQSMRLSGDIECRTLANVFRSEIDR